MRFDKKEKKITLNTYIKNTLFFSTWRLDDVLYAYLWRIIAIIYTYINTQSNNWNDKKLIVKPETERQFYNWVLELKTNRSNWWIFELSSSQFLILFSTARGARKGNERTRKKRWTGWPRCLGIIVSRGKKFPMGMKTFQEKRFFPIWCVWYTRARNTIPESGSNVLPRGKGARAIILQYPLRSHRNVERIKMRQKR